MKRTSLDPFKSTFHFQKVDPTRIQMSALKVASYVACMYDNHWFFGMIMAKDEDDDVQVNFMHPHGPSESFGWPQGKEDICYVPLDGIISVVDPPSTTCSGRRYHFSKKDADFANRKFLS